MRNIRSSILEAAGTSSPPDGWPGSPSRTRRALRGTAFGGEPGRGFCKDLPLLLELAVLAPQPGEFLAFSARQPSITLATVTGLLLDPQRDRPGRRPELPRQLRGRATAVYKFDHLALKLRCVPDRLLCHRESLQTLR